MVEDEVVSAHEFRGDDAGYLSWLVAHSAGYVINIGKNYNATGARMHHASCSTLRDQSGAQTDAYVKVCADHEADLEAWAIDHVGREIRPCGSCRAQPHPAHATPVMGTAPSVAGPLPAGRFLVPPPVPGSSVVEAWADDYIHYKPRPEWQTLLCNEIKTRCAHLNPSAGEVLHAAFYGVKPKRMDIENLLLYNIDSFMLAGRNGIRFEHGIAVPPSPDGEVYQVGYRYALAPRSGPFTDWQQGRTLVSFDWTNLGAFRRDKIPAQVWLALARRRGGEPGPALTAGTSFAVKVEIRPPHGKSPGLSGELVKGIIDGVVSAFQAHTETSTSGEVAARLAKVLPAYPAEIENLLLERRWAVLGPVARLVYLRDGAVQWNPGDDWCDAGELLAAEPKPADKGWAITGQIIQLSRRRSALATNLDA
jgi:hypothetical protein